MGCELLAQSSPSFWLFHGPSFSDCKVTFPSEGNAEKFTDMLRQKSGHVKEILASLLPTLPSPSKAHLPIFDAPSPHQGPRQTAVGLIMLLVAAMFSAQMLDVGMFGDLGLTELFGKGFKDELKDQEDTYAREGMWFLPSFLWLTPEEAKLMGVAAAPISLLLCVPVFFLNRNLSFVNLVITSLILIPMGLFYAFLSTTSTTWLLLLSPDKVSQLSLILRILGTVFPLIIAAFIFALQLSYIESIAQRNPAAEETNKKTVVEHHWSENVAVLLSSVVVTCSFASVSFNLMKSLSTQWSFTQHVSDENIGRVSSVEPSYLTFAFAHRALSASVMVVALLVFMVGKKFTGLTSFFPYSLL